MPMHMDMNNFMQGSGVVGKRASQVIDTTGTMRSSRGDWNQMHQVESNRTIDQNAVGLN